MSIDENKLVALISDIQNYIDAYFIDTSSVGSAAFPAAGGASPVGRGAFPAAGGADFGMCAAAAAPTVLSDSLMGSAPSSPADAPGGSAPSKLERNNGFFVLQFPRFGKASSESREMDENVKCVKLSKNYGEHSAILAGLSQCSGDCAVTKQADLQVDSGIILQMYESWKAGNKVVLAIRQERKENPIKVFFANMYYAIVRRMVYKNMPKGGCDCYLVDRKVIEVLERLDEKNSSLPLQVMWVGFKTDMIYFVI